MSKPNYRRFNNCDNRTDYWCNNPCLPQPCCHHNAGYAGFQGVTGPTGPRGPAGPQGPIGQTGQRGEIGPAGPQGKEGISGKQGSMGPAGPRGEQGLVGSQGDSVRLLGSYDSYPDFESDHPRGDPGDSYLVSGHLVTWNKTTSSWQDLGSIIGPTGPRGDRGPIASTIPFSIANSTYGQGINISTDEFGKPVNIDFAGFGASYTGNVTQLQPGEWDNRTITITNQISYPNSFIMPVDATLQSIQVLFANRDALVMDEGVIMRPFVCIAVSKGDSLVFSIISETITYTEPFVGGVEIPKYSLKKGFKDGLNISMKKGDLVGIVLGWVGEGAFPQQSAMVSVSGSLYMD